MTSTSYMKTLLDLDINLKKLYMLLYLYEVYHQ